jgi:general secretion pathway protein G
MLNKVFSRVSVLNGRSAATVSSQSGFTLLEIIIVLGIVGTLMAVLVGGLGSGGDSAKKKETAIKVNNVQSSLLKYQADVGSYPKKEEGLAALLTNPGIGAKWSGPYIGAEEDLQDSWNNKFEYELTPKGIKIISNGKDGQAGSEDDLVYINGRLEAPAAGGESPAK